MKIISWNVNGLRACLKKGFNEQLRLLDADVYCVQETKLQQPQVAELNLDFDGYNQFWNHADKKGYSGTAVFTRVPPRTVSYGIGIDEHDHEGRVITSEFNDFFLVNVYTPNSQRGLTRLDYRMRWETDFRDYLKELDQQKPLIICGDLNVAHQEIDLKNPKSNQNNAGFTADERRQLDRLLTSGFIDSYRHFYPERSDAYTWWSYMFNARARNIGWRIDYFICSARLANSLDAAQIYPEITGSDHCPVGLEIRT